jgi:hypothetical protein
VVPPVHLVPSFRDRTREGLGARVVGTARRTARAFRVVIPERIVASAVILIIVALGGSWSGVFLLAIVDVVLFIVLVAEYQRVERSRSPSASGDAEPAGETA